MASQGRGLTIILVLVDHVGAQEGSPLGYGESYHRFGEMEDGVVGRLRISRLTRRPADTSKARASQKAENPRLKGCYRGVAVAPIQMHSPSS